MTEQEAQILDQHLDKTLKYLQLSLTIRKAEAQNHRIELKYAQFFNRLKDGIKYAQAAWEEDERCEYLQMAIECVEARIREEKSMGAARWTPKVVSQ